MIENIPLSRFIVLKTFEKCFPADIKVQTQFYAHTKAAAQIKD